MGGASLLDTSLLSGAVEVRVESGGVTRDLSQVLTITGNRFAFDNAGFRHPMFGRKKPVMPRVLRMQIWT